MNVHKITLYGTYCYCNLRYLRREYCVTYCHCVILRNNMYAQILGKVQHIDVMLNVI